MTSQERILFTKQGNSILASNGSTCFMDYYFKPLFFEGKASWPMHTWSINCNTASPILSLNLWKDSLLIWSRMVIRATAKSTKMRTLCSCCLLASCKKHVKPLDFIWIITNSHLCCILLQEHWRCIHYIFS